MELEKNWEDEEAQLRRDWEQRYGYMGLGWESIKAAYRFGWVAGHLPEFNGLSWKRVEKDLAEHWYNPLLAAEESAWDYVKEAVEAGWKMARRSRSLAA